MNFDDHDWELAHPRAEDSGDTSTAWKVAAGVAVGIVLGGVLVYAAERYQAQAALVEAARSFEQMIRGADPTAAGAPGQRPAAGQAASQPSRDPTTHETAAEPERAAEPAAAAAPDAVEREAEAQRRAQQAADRKERAWASYYKTPAQCDDNPTRATMVECANHFIRARRQFDETYAAGKR